MRHPVAGLPRPHAARRADGPPLVRCPPCCPRPPPCEDRRDWERGERDIGGPEGRRVEREMERRTGVLATAAKE